MVFEIGAHTRIEVCRRPLPPDLKDAARSETKEVPMSVALPVMAGMAGAVMFAMSALATTDDRQGTSLNISRWYEMPSSFTPLFDQCLSAAQAKDEGRKLPSWADDAAFQSWRAATSANPGAAETQRADLKKALGTVVVDAHLLVEAGELRAAQERLLLIERMIPLKAADCPIVAASRSDAVRLELSASQ